MFEQVTLEMSLKPFKKTDALSVKKICKSIFTKWQMLLKERRTVSVMLWAADGSELLDYAGRLTDEFEWARFVGTANLPLLEEGEPKETSLHERKQSYTSNPPKMTYGKLKSIIKCLKSEGKRAFPDAKIEIGATFDIGPEFAVSDFKYRRHPEICSGTRLDGLGFVDATATLRRDSRPYAAYPDGIPEGEQFGSFLGKQAECFLSDMGFDYLWLSNGLGFSSNPWDKTGKIFDGKTYYTEKLEKTRERVFDFWRLFRKECSFPLKVRGTNNSVGIDYATDGVPLYDIYTANLGITAPPNSPWAALNDNFGLELMGHMTRICMLPSATFPFRYYIHDPWWINSPWYDRYDGTPCDVYLPMSISRINEEGRVESANSLNLLSIDNSYGDMPDACINEPLPHLLKAEKDSADEPAPLVWVYPMREYTTCRDGQTLKEMNLGDNYVCAAINDGLPLCCVVCTDNFLRHGSEIYRKSILISPIPEDAAVLRRIKELAQQGISTLMYGTKNRLDEIEDFSGLIKLCVEDDPKLMVEALRELGYSISFEKKRPEAKPPTMTLSRHRGGLLLSVYNSDTTTDTHLSFPLGAPVLCGTETQVVGNTATYRFTRSEHRECRIFVTQSDGVISCREAPPVNAKYRRAIKITGLKDARVCLFTETSCPAAVSVAKSTDLTPVLDSRFSTVQDRTQGDYLLGEHISGDIYFLIGHKS